MRSNARPSDSHHGATTRSGPDELTGRRDVMIWLMAGMALMFVLLVVVAACWLAGLVRLDRELRGRADHAALTQRFDLAHAASDRAD